MHNKFFDPEGERGEPPRKVYALLDQREGGTLFLDAVDADWFDNAVPPDLRFEGWVEVSRDARLSILQIDVRTPYAKPWPDLYPWSWDDGDDVSNDWVELGLNPAGEDALIYLGLFAAALPIGLEYVRPAPPQIAQSLAQAFNLTPYVATRQNILTALGNLHSTIEWIGVYDIGQGSANGLCDGQGVPLAYFDLGGGILANKASFPTAFRDICDTQRPPVILSHWDWDHWSSGARFARAAALTWIVPDQTLGAVHATFAATVAANGSLLVWPAHLNTLPVGQVTIEKCSGPSGRNHNGLALFVEGPNGEDPILLTGDARYTAIPSGGARYHSVVVPHHGADMRNPSTPACPCHAASRAAYSYGKGNSFAHPRSVTYQNHDKNGWAHSSLAPPAAVTVDRHTPALRPGLGHIALGWSATQPLPMQPCGAHGCSLQLVQR